MSESYLLDNYIQTITIIRCIRLSRRTTMTTSTRATIPRARPQGGPPLLAPALAYGVLMVTSVVLAAASPAPSGSATAVVSYDGTHHDALVVAGFLSFAAAAPL